MTESLPHDIPFACDLSVMTESERTRHQAVYAQLSGILQETQELNDGYAFRYPAEATTLLLAAEFISKERLCCPFFSFELSAPSGSASFWLRLTGREGVKDFLRAEMGI